MLKMFPIESRHDVVPVTSFSDAPIPEVALNFGISQSFH